MDLEIPLGKRTKKYRFFEILPGFFSYGAIILLIVLSIFNPLLASIYLLRASKDSARSLVGAIDT